MKQKEAQACDKMQRFGFEPGAKGQVSRDILPPPTAPWFQRQWRLLRMCCGFLGTSASLTTWWGQHVPDCTPPHTQQPPTGNNQQHLEQPPWNSTSSKPQGLCGHAVGNTRWMRRAPHCHVPRIQMGSENEATLHFTLLKVTKQLKHNLSKIFHTETATSISRSSVSSMAAI